MSSQPPTTFAQNCGKAPEVGCGQDFAGPILVFHQAVALEPVVHLLLLYLRTPWGSQQGCCMSQFSRTFLRFSSFLRVLRYSADPLCSWASQTFLEIWRSLCMENRTQNISFWHPNLFLLYFPQSWGKTSLFKFYFFPIFLLHPESSAFVWELKLLEGMARSVLLGSFCFISATSSPKVINIDLTHWREGERKHLKANISKLPSFRFLIIMGFEGQMVRFVVRSIGCGKFLNGMWHARSSALGR